MALGVLPVLVVLDEIDAGWMPWAWVLFCGLAWPQLAYLHAQCSRDPFAADCATSWSTRRWSAPSSR